MNQAVRIQKKINAVILLPLILFAALLLPVRAFAQEPGEIIRVGWYESPFNITDELGRHSGYAYEYQQRIAAYTGWTYEYVQGSWSDLMEMLKEGRIDLLSDVSYTEERAEKMLYPTLPMGEEEYYIFVSDRNKTISADDYATLNGKKVGANAGSLMASQFQEWAEANGIDAELIELTTKEEENVAKLRRGEIDMYVSLDAFTGMEGIRPLLRIGGSDFYFAVSKDCPELLEELNSAMSRILDVNPNYNTDLYASYIKTFNSSRYLTNEERAWLTAHGSIRVGYQDNYLAFCASDKNTGELTGALKDYLETASSTLEEFDLTFDAISFPTANAAMEAMKRGEVDCVFPANLTDYDGEIQGFFMTPALMRTDMSAVVREDDQKNFLKKERIAVAVNVGNPNYDMFLLEHFPDWRVIYYKDTPECLKAIADGQADCLLISNYRFNNISKLCQKYKLTTISTGVEMDYCFAVNRQDTLLYSILSKITGLVPAATVNSALSYYYTEDAKNSFLDLIRQNIWVIMGIFVIVGTVIIVLIYKGVLSKKKIKAGEQLISATEIDTLSGLYSKNYFLQYAERMHRESPEKHFDAAVLNIDQFHAVNAVNGREFGDQILRGLSDEIRRFLEDHEGIGGHSEGDRFAIYCVHPEDWYSVLSHFQNRLDIMSPNATIILRMGVMPWQPEAEPRQMFEQARIACNLGRGQAADRLVIYDDKIRKKDEVNQRLLVDIRRAVEEHQFEVYYQPKYDIREAKPVLASAEALVRWRHPEYGLVMPDSFIPLLENIGLITTVDKFVWGEAARQVASWKETYGVSIPVSVNLSRVDLFDPALERTLEELLKKNGLSHSEFKLEVTESACTENEVQVIDVVERLRRRGFEIEMDDFGTGYSSLSMLSSMPVDVLKMDRAFVSNIETEEKDRQLVELILSLARKLKIPVVAEGVETEAQLKLLKELGCPLVQGYYFSKPLPADVFEQQIINK